MSGKLHTSCILYIAKRHPPGCPKCLWLKPYPPNLFLARERICDYASSARRILETIRQRFRRPAAPRPKTQVPVSAEPNGNLIVELVHRIFRRFRFQIGHRPSFPRLLPSRCGVPRFAAPAAYGFPRRRGFQHFDGRRVPRPTRSLSECWKPRQVSPRFRQVEGFSALSMAGGFLD